MTQMIRWIGILALVWTVGCGKKDAQVVTPEAASGTEVAIWVDDSSISAAQVQAEVGRLSSQAPKDISPDLIPDMKRRILQQAIDNLVVRLVLLREMDQSEIWISQTEVEVAKAEIEKELGTGQSLALTLAAANQSVENLETNLRLDLFKNKVLEEKQNAAVDLVTDAVIQAYYDENPKEFTTIGGRLASHILINVPIGADEAVVEERREIAEGLRQQLLKGADFEKMALQFSACISRTRGGQLGVILRNPEIQGVQEFEDAVYGRELGVIGELVQSPDGFHIVKATGEEESRLVPFDEVQTSIEMVMKKKARQDVVADYIAGLKGKAIIKLDGPLASMDAVEAEPQAPAAPDEDVPLLNSDSFGAATVNP